MNKIIKIWFILLAILGIFTVAFIFYKTVIKNDYDTVSSPDSEVTEETDVTNITDVTDVTE